MDDTQVDVCGTLKGGVGKTRLAMLKALYLAKYEGESVHVLCADRVSQTASDWRKDYERLHGKGSFPVKVTRYPLVEIADYVEEELLGRVDRVIIDVGGGDADLFKAALKWANRLFVPIGADPSEVRRLAATWKAAQEAAADSARGGFDSWLLLSRTDHGTSLPAEYRRILSGYHPDTGERTLPQYPLMDTELRKNVDYQRAFPTVPKQYIHVPDVLVEAGVIKERKDRKMKRRART